MKKTINKHLPKSLFGRALLIIMLPITIMQIAVVYFFFNLHWDQVTSNLSDSVAADISVAVQLYKQNPTLEQVEKLENLLRPKMELSVALELDDELPTIIRSSFFSNLDKTLSRSLNNSVVENFWFDTTKYPNHIDIRIKVNEGVLRFIAARERVFAPLGYVFIFWLVMATILLSLVSIYFIRNQATPISELANAADAFGRGEDKYNFRPSGASEVRLAGQSFLKMRGRIKRHIEQRTIMLAGVSHDLKTPLTRLKLHLSMQHNSEENKAAKQDIKDMESMLEAYLDFARGLEGEALEAINIYNFIQKLVTKMKLTNVQLIAPFEITVSIRPRAMERALMNLIENTQKYAKNCRITLTKSSESLLISIEDDGEGIPKNKRKSAFKAFHRLDISRNQNIEGVGLGLSIARDIAQNHGGSLKLHDSSMGGLKAILRIPI
ncbi:ATP-binding protein [Hellea sp.]|nr:ATP-binding protein [Hellea sp.]